MKKHNWRLVIITMIINNCFVSPSFEKFAGFYNKVEMVLGGLEIINENKMKKIIIIFLLLINYTAAQKKTELN